MQNQFETVTQIDSSLIKQASHLLAVEFYPPERYEEGLADYLRQLESGKAVARISMLDGNVVGIATFNVYDWQRIRGQLYYQPKFKEDRIASLRLRRFEDAITDVTTIVTPGTTVEMAYNLVLPEYRGKGLGSLQWKARMEYIKTNYENPLLFTLARSEYSGVGIAPATISYMLAQERSAQGLTPETNVVVQGVEVSIRQMATDLNLNIADLGIHSGSKPTIHLAQQDGFIPIGFSRNFCPVWVKQLVNKPTEIDY